MIDRVKSFKDIVQRAGFYKEYNPSETFISKVLMGITGCIPAFDRNFKIAARDFNAVISQCNKKIDIHIADSLSIKTLESIRFIVMNNAAMDYISSFFEGMLIINSPCAREPPSYMPYPATRMLDLFFWTYCIRK